MAHRRVHDSAIVAERITKIAAVLISAIAKARARADEYDVDAKFRAAVIYAREVHDVLVAALSDNEPLMRDYLRDLAATTDNSIEELEAFAAGKDGR